MLTYVTKVGKLYNILLNKEKRGLGALEKVGNDEKNPKQNKIKDKLISKIGKEIFKAFTVLAG